VRADGALSAQCPEQSCGCPPLFGANRRPARGPPSVQRLPRRGSDARCCHGHRGSSSGVGTGASGLPPADRGIPPAIRELAAKINLSDAPAAVEASD
jgi:hypothetical protein